MPGDTPTVPPAPLGVRAAFPRTVCDCRRCSISCEHLPGALAPSDLAPMAAHLGFKDPAEFAREHLVVSEGPTLRPNDGRTVSLPTLVPSSDATGACRYYDAGVCTIHAVSPFGCSHIDAHMPEAEFLRRSNALYAELLRDRQSAGLYARLADEFGASGRSAPPRSLRHARLVDAMKREKLVEP